MYLYRAIDSNGDTVEFWFTERRDLTAARRFLRKPLKRHDRPERIVIDGSRTNREAILACDTENQLQDQSRRKLKPIRIRQSRYLNNRTEQDHRAIKRRVRPMLGFKSIAPARVILSWIEMVHMMREQQAKYACNRHIALAEQSTSWQREVCGWISLPSVSTENSRQSPPDLLLSKAIVNESLFIGAACYLGPITIQS